MKRIAWLLILGLALPMLAAAENWNNAPIVDANCSAKVKANPDAHTRSCALTCSRSGYGILDKNGNYLKFDQNGNQQALKMLQSSSKKDHLRVDVQGQKDGNVIHVQSLKMM